MSYKGTGCMTEFVESWNVVLEALANPVTIHTYDLEVRTSITVREDVMEIDFS